MVFLAAWFFYPLLTPFLSHTSRHFVLDKLARVMATRDAAEHGRLLQAALAAEEMKMPTTRRPLKVSSGRSTERSKEQSTENKEQKGQVGSSRLEDPGPSSAEHSKVRRWPGFRL